MQLKIISNYRIGQSPKTWKQSTDKSVAKQALWYTDDGANKTAQPLKKGNLAISYKIQTHFLYSHQSHF